MIHDNNESNNAISWFHPTEDFQMWKAKITRKVVEKDDCGFNEYTMIEQCIGSKGQFGHVSLCEREKGRRYAVKFRDKSKAEKTIDLDPLTRKLTNRLHRLRDEIDILSTLYHRNVMLTFEIVECESTIRIVSELLKPSHCCWDAKSKAFTHRRLSERKCHEYFCDLLRALRYLKENHICHGDIRPSNICFNCCFDEVVVCDFGEAVRLQDGQHTIRTQYGTKEFWSPEKLSCGASGFDGYEADLWAAMVTLYIWHKSSLPKRLDDGEIIFESTDSKALQDLIRTALSLNRSERLTCTDSVVKHGWIGGEIALRRREEAGNALRRHRKSKES